MQKLPSNNHTVVRSQEFERHTMGVAPESVNQIAGYLRDGIYSDSILASIREYTTNALDEHIKLGITRPVEVRLDKTELRIRDFGLGLAKDPMFKIFGQLGMSGKRDDNTQAGCFGIGSSAAFSYSDSFTGVSIHDGVKSIYAFILEDVDGCSVPTANLISEDFCDEPSGIEITIPIKEGDYHNFLQTAKHFFVATFANIDFQHFDDEWTSVDLTFKDILCEHEVTVEGYKVPFKIHENSYMDHASVKMGPVCYYYHFPEIRKQINAKIIVDVPIGSIDLAISRESIKHTQKTRIFMDKVEAVIVQYIDDLIKEFAADPTPLDIFLSDQGELPQGNGWFRPKKIKEHIVLDNPLEFMKINSSFYEEMSKSWSTNKRLVPHSKNIYDHNIWEHIVIIGEKAFGDKKLCHFEKTFNILTKRCLFIKGNRSPDEIDESVRELVLDLRDYDWPKAPRQVRDASQRTLRARLSGNKNYSYLTEQRWVDTYGDLPSGGFIAWATDTEIRNKSYRGIGVFVADTKRAEAFAKKQGFVHIDKWIKDNANHYKKEIEINSKGTYFTTLPLPIQNCFDKKLFEGKRVSLEAQVAQAFITEKIEIHLDKKAKKVHDLIRRDTLLGAACKLLQYCEFLVPPKVKKQIIETIEKL
jgi:hypothetical protein